jgi:hypothetical protein
MATGQICGVLLMATGEIFQTFPTDVSTTNYTGLRGVGVLLVKLWGYSYNFDIAESKYDNQTALPQSSVKGSG